MSEQRVKDFAEAAEQRVPVPDLADLTSRGRDLRRVRRAAAAGALALAVVAGGVLSTMTRDDRSDAPAVDRTPPPSVDAQELGPRSLQDSRPGGREGVRRTPLAAVQPGRHRGPVPGSRTPLGVARGRCRPPADPRQALPHAARALRAGGSGDSRPRPRHGVCARGPGVDPVGGDADRGRRGRSRGFPTSWWSNGRSRRAYSVIRPPTCGSSVPRLCPEYGDVIVWGQASHDRHRHGGATPARCWTCGWSTSTASSSWCTPS